MAEVLVTGGAGFIGSHTVVALHEAGHRVTLLDDLRRSNSKMLDGIAAITGATLPCHFVDVGNVEGVRSVLGDSPRPFDVVVHFAAYKSVRESVVDPLLYYRNNVCGTMGLLDSMALAGVSRLVFSSSCTVYGQPALLPVHENSPLLPAASPYGATKQICEQMIGDSVRSLSGLHHAISLRYFNPVGAHESARIGEIPFGTPDNLVPFITQTAAGLRSHVDVFGSDYATRDGSAIRDYVHVVDIAEAHVAAVDQVLRAEPGMEAYNLGCGSGASVLEVIAAFEQATGVRVRHALAARRAGDVEAIWATCERAASVLGWRANRSLEDMMESAWRWQLTL